MNTPQSRKPRKSLRTFKRPFGARKRSVGASFPNLTIQSDEKMSEDDPNHHVEESQVPLLPSTSSRWVWGAGRALRVKRSSLRIVRLESLQNRIFLQANKILFEVDGYECDSKPFKLMVSLTNSEDEELEELSKDKSPIRKSIYAKYGAQAPPPGCWSSVILGRTWDPPRTAQRQSTTRSYHFNDDPCYFKAAPRSPVKQKPESFPSPEMLTDLRVRIFGKEGKLWKEKTSELFDAKLQFMIPLFELSEVEDFFRNGTGLTLHFTFRFFPVRSKALSFHVPKEGRPSPNPAHMREQPDAVLISKEGKSFLCHEQVLKERSLFFADASEVKDHITKGMLKYQLDISSKAVEFLLQFIYKSEINESILGEFVSEGRLEELLVGARKFQIQELLTLFEDNLLALCWDENAEVMLKLAKEYHLPKAAEQIMAAFDLHDEENGDHLYCMFCVDEDRGTEVEMERQESRPEAEAEQLTRSTVPGVSKMTVRSK